MSKHEVWFSADDGTRIKYIDDVLFFEYVKSVNSIGQFVIGLPERFDISLLEVDRRFEFWRAHSEDSLLQLDFIGWIRGWRYTTDENGVTSVSIFGPDSNDLLTRRIINAAAGSAGAAKSGPADDVMKAYVDEALGASASANRDVTGYGFSVQSNLGDGASVAGDFARQNLLSVLQQLANASRSAGTELYFDVVPKTRKSFEFRTFTGQRGTDRRWPTASNPIIFGLEYGNLGQPTLEFDYSGEVNYVYAGGQLEEGSRNVRELSNSARVGKSRWNRREGFADARRCEAGSANENACIDAAGNEVLNASRPLLKFGGNLIDTPQTRYQRDWGFGDRVTVTYMGRKFDAMIRSVTVRLEPSGREVIAAYVESET